MNIYSKVSKQFCSEIVPSFLNINRKRGSSVVSALASGARGPRFNPARGEENFGVRTRFP